MPTVLLLFEPRSAVVLTEKSSILHTALTLSPSGSVDQEVLSLCHWGASQSKPRRSSPHTMQWQLLCFKIWLGWFNFVLSSSSRLNLNFEKITSVLQLSRARSQPLRGPSTPHPPAPKPATAASERGCCCFMLVLLERSWFSLLEADDSAQGSFT